ncbi:fumarylacetoacetate hydrolase family protein [Bradyrhizobium sp. Arg62]|uniref:2-keto-4-pentenoate hydratase n=1 Tax=Bradyrhizobium brasilense TaxID=1419277 RepID=UPI001E4F9DB0|nr:fumarylacetoacetate hydrolase family protein [Bradyrhizobium brasilense]MCC8943922.1 fumarylacetoacetate hydrolase family protein [Bradyrhizobium brasilense]
MNAIVDKLATRLQEAESARRPIDPIAAEIGAGNIEIAYAVQSEVTRRGLSAGRRLVGRKIGLTSKAVQQQLGVDQPDYCALFADMEVPTGEAIDTTRLIQPRIEAEIALVLERDLSGEDVTLGELMRSTAYAVGALEVVDSRVRDWKISILDTVADNGSSARYVLGASPRRLTDLDLEGCSMTMTRNGVIASLGCGAACLGHPLRAGLWLARAMARAGQPLRGGDVVLTGALGPVSPVSAGEVYEAKISGFGPVCVTFT